MQRDQSQDLEKKHDLPLALGRVNETPHNIPHGPWRLIILAIALFACLFAGWSDKTPNDTRSTFLSIGSAIITGLIRPFDR
jgi:hypothetical protein